MIKEVVEVGSLIDDGRAKERGSDDGGSSGDEWRGLDSLGREGSAAPGLCSDSGSGGWLIPGAEGSTGSGTPAVWDK